MLRVRIFGLPVMGYHDYKKKLCEEVKKGERLKLAIEKEMFFGTSTFPVAATRDTYGFPEKIGHIPKEYSWCFKAFLRADNVQMVVSVASEESVIRNGEEIICNFFIVAPDSPEIHNALDCLYKILQDPYWDFYKPKMEQNIKEGKKWVYKEWSIKTEDGDRQKQDNIPEELKHDPFTRQQFEKAISEGEEPDKSLRIMVIGCYGQGKTSLVKKLFKENVKRNEKSTNGIDVINFDVKSDYTWERRTIDTDVDTDAARRLAAVVYPKDGQDKNNQYTTRRKRHEDRSSTEAETKVNAKKIKVEASGSYTNNDSEVVGESQSQGEISRMSSSYDSDIFKSYSSVLSDSSLHYTTDAYLSGSVWDFGGQYIFYSTHQLFHSRQAIYLLVFDLSLGLDTIVEDEDFPNKKNVKTLKDYLRFWVNSVHCFVGSNDGEEPHIILVGTHKDEISADQDVDDYFEEVRSMFDDTKLIRHIYPQHFAVSNIGQDTQDFQELRGAITRLGKHLSEERAHLPARWILLEKSLKEKQHERITSFDNVLAINKEIQYPLAEQDEVKLFLQFHHARGSLFHFNDIKLSNYVVLDPQYLIDAFKCIVTSRKFCLTQPKLRDAWRQLCEDAILQKALIEELWETNTNFLQHKEVLLGFLHRHRIIAPVLEYYETKDISSNPGPVDCYIVPSLLKNKSSARLVSSFIKYKALTKVALVYEFENDCIVGTVFQRFTAAALGRWPPVSYKKQSLLYENLSVFEIQLDHAGMTNFRDGMLELLVVNLCPSKQVSSEVCDLFRCFFEAVVFSEFRKLSCIGESGSPGERKLFTSSIRCYDEIHGLYGSDKMYTLKKVENARLSIPCPDFSSHTFNAQDGLHMWYNTDIIDIKSVPKRELTDQECVTLSTEVIERGWEILAYKLGISIVEVEHINEDFPDKSQKILRMLKKWQGKKEEKATLDVLVTAIRKIRPSELTMDEDKLKGIIYGLG